MKTVSYDEDAFVLVPIDTLQSCVLDAISYLSSDAGLRDYGRHCKEMGKDYQSMLDPATPSEGESE